MAAYDKSFQARLVRVVTASLKKYGLYESGCEPYIEVREPERIFVGFQGGPSYFVTVHECDDTE